MSLLEMKNVTKKFKGLVAVNDVSLHVEQGEIISIIGPKWGGQNNAVQYADRCLPGDIRGNHI